MARWMVGVGVGLLALVGVGAVAVYDILGGMFAGLGQIVPQGSAQHTTLRDHLGANQPESVAVYMNGTWGLITDVGGASDVRFSYFKGGLLRRLADHGTCQNSTEKVFIEPVLAGVLADPIASCAHPETDITALIALSQPAALRLLPSLPLSQWRAQAARLESDPALFAANASEPQSDYDFTCGYDFPFVWQADGHEGGYLMTRFKDAVDAATLAALGPNEERYALQVSTGYSSSYVMHAAEGTVASPEGWALDTSTAYIERDGAVRKIPGLSIYRPSLRLFGTRADCAGFEAIEFDDWAADRDISLLEAAWGAGVAQPRGPGTALAWDDLVGITQGRASAPKQLLYDFRYFELK